MKKSLAPAAVGALVRAARTAAGLSQSELGKRIGASRFWVAQFEKGKPGAELGLALKALHALGLDVRVESRDAAGRRARGEPPAPRTAPRTALPAVDLGQIIAKSTLTSTTAPHVVGWPVSLSRRASK